MADSNDDSTFRSRVCDGDILVQSHYDLLRFIYTDQCETVFEVVDNTHRLRLSFGIDDLKFNRTLDVFYATQLMTATWRVEAQAEVEGEIARTENFADLYSRHEGLLGENVWQQFYSRDFLLRSATAHFWRLPDLQDLPDANDPWGLPRQKNQDHFTRLPYWAHNVVRTFARQPTLSKEVLVNLALTTLKENAERQQARNSPRKPPPFSITQCRFWLDYFGLDKAYKQSAETCFMPYSIGEEIARGHLDVLAWQKEYTPQRWYSVEGQGKHLAPDHDGSSYKSPPGTGFPDGGTGFYALQRGWMPEVGSEEEVEFLASVAVKELDGRAKAALLDYEIRSHMLMSVLLVVLEPDETRQQAALTETTQRIIAAGRLTEDAKAEAWITQVIEIMRPYVKERMAGSYVGEHSSAEAPITLLAQILMENGQLFGRYKFGPNFENSRFALRPGTMRERT